jgi:hypothetical protein
MAVRSHQRLSTEVWVSPLVERNKEKQYVEIEAHGLEERESHNWSRVNRVMPLRTCESRYALVDV